jgi:hypothetical protein
MKQVSLNFGAIKDTIVRFSGKQIVSESKENGTVLNSFLNSLKENTSLKIQYLVYKNLEQGHFKKERLAERYINQNIKLLESLDWEKVINSNRDLRIGLLENCHVEGNAGKGELYENIHTLIESVTRKGFSDIEKSEAAYESIMEHLLRDKSEEESSNIIEEDDSPKLLSWQFVTKLAVNNFNQRYSHLNEDERDLLKILLSPDSEKKAHLESIVKENNSIIDNILETEDVENEVKITLESFKSKMENVSDLISENIDDAIMNVVELKNTLKEII